MENTTSLLLEIFLIFLIAKIAGELLEWINFPAILGELSVGMLIGPSALNLIHHPNIIHAFAEIGIILLMFKVGLESKLSELLTIGKTSIWIATGGVVVPFISGFGVCYVYGYNTIEAMFLGTALVATSVGITARVLEDLKVLQSLEAKVILSAAVFDDILGMVVLGIVSGISSNSFSLMNIFIILGEVTLFLVVAFWANKPMTRNYEKNIASFRTKNSVFVTSILFCLGMAALASYIHLAGIIGAFIAGIILSEATEDYDLDERIESLTDFLVPFFFVLIGASVNVHAFYDLRIIGFGLLITFLAIIGKLIGCGLISLKYGKRSAFIIGWGMVPRGEVGLIVASIGLGSNILSNNIYITIVFMSLLTTAITPWILQYYYKNGS